MAKHVSAAVLTVCVDREVTREIVAHAEAMPWTLHTADFEAYVSPVRRPHLTQQVRSAELCVAFVNLDANAEQAMAAAVYLQQVFRGRVALVALSSSSDAGLLLAAMRAGCTEFLQPETLGAELPSLFERLDEARLHAEAMPLLEGSVLSFFGAKGGVGATTMAVHLAMYLVQVHAKRVLLIDNQPELGHVCVYLGLDGTRYNFHEVVRNVNRLDSELLRGFTAKHASGLEVLSSPDVCGGTKQMDADGLARLLQFLRSEYDYVLVDCATSLDEANLAVIEGSTQVYLVATPEISAIRDLSRYVDSLTQVEHAIEKTQVVINRFSSRYAVDVEHIEKAIRLPVRFKLPNSYFELVRSVNLGEPIAPNRKSEFSAQFLAWAEGLAGPAVQAREVAQDHRSLRGMVARVLWNRKAA